MIQKISVILCSIAIIATLMFMDTLDSMADGSLHHVVHAVVIALAIIAELSTMAYQRIELEKDWFVVITEGDESKLASMSASFCPALHCVLVKQRKTVVKSLAPSAVISTVHP